MAIRKKHSAVSTQQSVKTRKSKGNRKRQNKNKHSAVATQQSVKPRKSKDKGKRQNKNKQLAQGAPGSSTVGHWHLARTKAKNKKRARSSSSITQSLTHQLTKVGSASFALPRTRLTHFRELKGKIIEDVLFSAAPDHQDITIKLQDKTGLSFSIATGLILKTEYSDWTSGEQRIVRSWVLKKAAIGN